MQTVKTTVPLQQKRVSRLSDRENRKTGNLKTAESSVSPVLQLHQVIGNQAVGQLIQKKLKIGQPHDKYEQEADRIADEVMRMPEPQVQRAPS